MRLNVPPGNRDNAGNFATIPAGSTLQLPGSSTLSGLVDVVWNGARYALFPGDLAARAMPLSK